MRFARSFENVAASTYAHAAAVLTERADRRTMMGIGGVEARHAAVLQQLLEDAPAAVPRPFIRTEVFASEEDGRIPDTALIRD